LVYRNKENRERGQQEKMDEWDGNTGRQEELPSPIKPVSILWSFPSLHNVSLGMAGMLLWPLIKALMSAA